MSSQIWYQARRLANFGYSIQRFRFELAEEHDEEEYARFPPAQVPADTEATGHWASSTPLVTLPTSVLSMAPWILLAGNKALECFLLSF